ncbi:hypothetical protein QT972_08115 [Microcoleus sp. herbarium7]|uniref:hypothetical protein n=1 Tax=Microcoleus sp. herbarium7 TaxID=3055435 RepID=UPI002FD6F13A
MQNLPKIGQFFGKQEQVFNVGCIPYISADGNYPDAGYFIDPGNFISVQFQQILKVNHIAMRLTVKETALN